MKYATTVSCTFYYCCILIVTLPAMVHFRCRYQRDVQSRTSTDLFFAMLVDPTFRSLLHRRQFVFWKYVLRNKCIEAKLPYIQRLQLVGWV